MDRFIVMFTICDAIIFKVTARRPRPAVNPGSESVYPIGTSGRRPLDAPVDLDWAHQLVAEGHAHWNGSKPNGALRPAIIKGRAAASIVIEDRR